jgi:hypothetical protein
MYRSAQAGTPVEPRHIWMTQPQAANCLPMLMRANSSGEGSSDKVLQTLACCPGVPSILEKWKTGQITPKSDSPLQDNLPWTMSSFA